MWDGVSRRKFPRAEYPCLITIRKNTHPKEAILTHTENVSIGGVRVIISKRLGIMTEVDIEIDLKDTFATILSKGSICWVKEVDAQEQEVSQRFDTGIRFIGLKDTDRRRIQSIIVHLLDQTT